MRAPCASVAYGNLLADINCRHEGNEDAKVVAATIKKQRRSQHKGSTARSIELSTAPAILCCLRVETDKNGVVPYMISSRDLTPRHLYCPVSHWFTFWLSLLIASFVSLIREPDDVCIVTIKMSYKPTTVNIPSHQEDEAGYAPQQSMLLACETGHLAQL